MAGRGCRFGSVFYKRIGGIMRAIERVSKLRRGLIAPWLLCWAIAAHATPVTPAAQRVIDTIDALDVEHHWPAGIHVNWQTGEPDGLSEHTPGKHTHCSAFAAAAAKRLNIYLLRPPEHGQILLANAQWAAQSQNRM
jgi:hypothetical protein